MTDQKTSENRASRTDEDTMERYAKNLQMEREGIALYEELSKAEKDPDQSRKFSEMAEMERHHAEVWESKLQEAGGSVPAPRRMIRPKLVGALARLFGTRQVAPMIGAMESGAARDYMRQGDAPSEMVRDERAHAQVFTDLSRPGVANIVNHESWHRSSRSGSLRAGIFGINDGLVSNLSLVLGVAGADPGQGVVLLAGVAGLIAGASSMAAGEYISMRTQREVFERQMELEAEEIELAPEAELEELSLIYKAKGVEKSQADALAATVMSDKTVALRTMALEELGMDPDELGSPWGAAIASFLMFTVGAIIPILGFIFATGGAALVTSIVVSGLALLTVGGLLSFLTGRSALYGAARMFLIGGVAAAVTFAIGNLVGGVLLDG